MEQTPKQTAICRVPKTFTNYLGHNRRAFFGAYRLHSEGIAMLLNLMGVECLDPRFDETFGYHAAWPDPDCERARCRKGFKSYLGNFLEISCVFNIDTRDEDLIADLDEAIRLNRATPQYQEELTFIQAEEIGKREAFERMKRSLA